MRKALHLFHFFSPDFQVMWPTSRAQVTPPAFFKRRDRLGLESWPSVRWQMTIVQWTCSVKWVKCMLRQTSKQYYQYISIQYTFAAWCFINLSYFLGVPWCVSTPVSSRIPECLDSLLQNPSTIPWPQTRDPAVRRKACLESSYQVEAGYQSKYVEHSSLLVQRFFLVLF